MQGNCPLLLPRAPYHHVMSRARQRLVQHSDGRGDGRPGRCLARESPERRRPPLRRGREPRPLWDTSKGLKSAVRAAVLDMLVARPHIAPSLSTCRSGCLAMFGGHCDLSAGQSPPRYALSSLSRLPRYNVVATVLVPALVPALVLRRWWSSSERLASPTTFSATPRSAPSTISAGITERTPCS